MAGRAETAGQVRAVGRIMLAAVLATTASRLAAGADNPALERFGRAIVLYVSFDGHAQAEINGGSPTPQVSGPALAATDYTPGRLGQGLRAGEGTLSYLCKDLALGAAGSLALWVQPETLAHRGTYWWPVRLQATEGGYGVMFGRMGDPRNKEQLYAYLQQGKAGVSAVAGSMAGWKPGEWHLLVATWTRDSVEFSVDGNAPVRASLRTPLTAARRSGFRATLFSPNEDRFVLDEFLVLDVPLTREEIAWLYAQGAAPRVETP